MLENIENIAPAVRRDDNFGTRFEFFHPKPIEVDSVVDIIDNIIPFKTFNSVDVFEEIVCTGRVSVVGYYTE